jgi:two-component system, NtrC family, sensor kinase
MRITRQLVLAFVVAMALVFTVYGWVSHRRTTEYFDSEVRREVHSLGHAVGAAVERTWKEDGPEQALRLIAQMNEPGPGTRIRWVWLEGEATSEHRPSVAAAEIAAAAGAREVVRHQRSEDGEDRLLTYFLLAPDAGRRGALEISESMARQETFARSSLVTTAITLVVLALACGGALGILGVWLVGRPIGDLVAQARRIGGGDLSWRLEVRRRDEISDLVEEMNRMCDRLTEARQRIAAETSARLGMLEQLRHADRLTTVGTLAAGVAHELGSPLQVVLGRARLIAGEHGCSPAIAAQGRAIAEQAERMSIIIRHLLDFARRRTLTTASFDVGKVVGQTVNLLAPLARNRETEIAFRAPEAPLDVRIDAVQIQQVLTNLIMNAIQARPRNGRVAVSAGSERIVSPPDRGAVALDCCWVRIEDQGHGIDPKDLPRIFEPFFTTKDVGEGTGLGLPVAHGIVEEHGGWITVESQPGRGSTFTIHLPRREAA